MKTTILLVKDLLKWLHPPRKERKRKKKDGPISKHMRRKAEKIALAAAGKKMDFSRDNLVLRD